MLAVRHCYLYSHAISVIHVFRLLIELDRPSERRVTSIPFEGKLNNAEGRFSLSKGGCYPSMDRLQRGCGAVCTHVQGVFHVYWRPFLASHSGVRYQVGCDWEASRARWREGRDVTPKPEQRMLRMLSVDPPSEMMNPSRLQSRLSDDWGRRRKWMGAWRY